MNKIDSALVEEFGTNPAYPVAPGAHLTGASLRDWLALGALQGLAAKGLDVNANRAMSQEDRDLEMATRAYGLADAMLTVRGRNSSGTSSNRSTNTLAATPRPSPKSNEPPNERAKAIGLGHQ